MGLNFDEETSLGEVVFEDSEKSSKQAKIMQQQESKNVHKKAAAITSKSKLLIKSSESENFESKKPNLSDQLNKKIFEIKIDNCTLLEAIERIKLKTGIDVILVSSLEDYKNNSSKTKLMDQKLLDKQVTLNYENISSDLIIYYLAHQVGIKYFTDHENQLIVIGS